MAKPPDAGPQSSKTPALVWIDCPHSVISVGLEQALEGQARVHVGRETPEEDVPFTVILCAEGVEGLSEGVKRVQELYPNASILTFGLHADVQLARVAFQAGAQGFVHAGMTPDQLARAVMVAANGEPVAPRELLQHLIVHEDPVDLHILSARQKEILELVVNGLSNAQIAARLYLSESTVKQHLRAAYKLLGVKNRTEAARLIRNNS
jgi:DNA-binding NarL/FixJ family response regulator